MPISKRKQLIVNAKIELETGHTRAKSGQGRKLTLQEMAQRRAKVKLLEAE